MAVATAALDACMMTVSAIPIPTRMSRPVRLGSGNASGCTCAARLFMPCCSVSIPMKISPKPAMANPIEAIRPLSMSRISAPIPTSGIAMVNRLSFNPSSETIQPVVVVPTLLPMMTPMDCEKVISPALTKPMVASVVALEDCTIAVMVSPERKAEDLRSVNCERIRLSVCPAAVRNPSVSNKMPSRNKPIPPRS